MKYRFYISRYAALPQHAKFIYRAIASIHSLYSKEEYTITVVDDNSRLMFFSDDPNITVVQNPYPKSGEAGTLYVAWKAITDDEDIIITMHDSMVLRKRIDACTLNINNFLFLWDFDRYHVMHLHSILRLLGSLDTSHDNLLKLTLMFVNEFNISWKGCFGMCLLLRKGVLSRIQDVFGLFSDGFMKSVNDRDSRQACERIFGLVFSSYAQVYEKNRKANSLCGNIFNHPNPWNTETATSTLSEILSISYNSHVHKTWAGR